MPVFLLSSYLMAPRVGHLEQAIHFFAYLKKYNCSKIVLDDTYPSFDNSRFFELSDCSAFYLDATDPIPTNAPVARGNPVIMSYFVDTDHAGCNMPRRSHTGILVYVNRTSVFFSKR